MGLFQKSYNKGGLSKVLELSDLLHLVSTKYALYSSFIALACCLLYFLVFGFSTVVMVIGAVAVLAPVVCGFILREMVLIGWRKLRFSHDTRC